MRWLISLLVLFTVSAIPSLGSSPAEAVALAWMDVDQIPAYDRPFIRYLSLYAIPDRDRADFLKVLAFQINSLSRKRVLAPIRTLEEHLRQGSRSSIVLVGKDLLRLDIRYFGWDREVYEKLATVDPYFHMQVRVDPDAFKKNAETLKEVVPDKPDLSEQYYLPGDQTNQPPAASGWAWYAGGVYSNGIDYPRGWYSPTSELYLVSKGKKPRILPKLPPKPVPSDPAKLVNRAAAAPWASPQLLYGLVKQTQSEAPILRADWFFTQTAINFQRVAGYYAFLGLKSRKDFEALSGFDIKRAQRIEREVAAIIQVSGVSIRNRQIYRFGSVDRGYWQTRDAFKKQTQERNAVNSLNGDYVHDAEEYYAYLPNDLFAYYLSDAQGNQQDSAPDEVGSDPTTTSNDFKIHIFLSCVRCHVEGLRPLNDYGRKLFQAPARLVAYDKKKFDRLEQLYLTPLQRDQDRDTQIFKDALTDLNGVGWTPARNAAAVKKVWKAWTDDTVTVEMAARELGGITANQLVARIKRYASPIESGGLGQVIPNVLLAYLHDRPLPIIREHFEEVYHVLQLIAGGYVPAQPGEKPK